MFDRLVWMVVGYGVEIWGWEESEGVEIGRKIPEMVDGGRAEDTGVHGKGRIAEGKIEGQGREESMGV